MALSIVIRALDVRRFLFERFRKGIGEPVVFIAVLVTPSSR